MYSILIYARKEYTILQHVFILQKMRTKEEIHKTSHLSADQSHTFVSPVANNLRKLKTLQESI